MTQLTATGGRTQRLTWLALALSVGGTLAALAGAVGSGAGLWPYGAGFAILRYAFYLVMAGGLIAIVAFILARRAGTRMGKLNLAALLIAVVFAAYLMPRFAAARSLPAIHDISTDLADPPRFAGLPIRADNLENVPDQGRPDLAATDPEQRWKALDRQAYGDLSSLRTRVSPAEALRRAEALVQERGWSIARVDRQHGTIEATATSLFFRFKDDVVIRVVPDPSEHKGAIVDMRSISRVGSSDVGVNAARIRAFFVDLRASLKTAG